MTKFDIEAIENSNKEDFRRISRLLLELGVPIRLRGFVLLKYAIFLKIYADALLIKKSLYQLIGEVTNNITREDISSIEGAIRHALRRALSKGKLERLNDMLGTVVVTKNAPLSALQFISIAAEIIDLRLVNL